MGISLETPFKAYTTDVLVTFIINIFIVTSYENAIYISIYVLLLQ